MSDPYPPQGQPESAPAVPPPPPPSAQPYPPPAPPPPPMQPYPVQGQPYPPPMATSLPEHPKAVTSLVLGLLGLFVFAPLAPFAWSIASKARKEIRLSPGRYAESGTLTAGYVTGVIGTVVLIIAVAVGLFFLLILGGLIASQPR